MANPPSLRWVLRIRLDSSSVLTSQAIQISQLDSPSRSLRSGCPTLGPDLVGNIWVRSFPPLGRELYRWCPHIPQLMALAWGLGCIARCRLWYDFVANTNTHAYLLHSSRVTGPGLSGNYLREVIRTKQNWTWANITGYDSWCERVGKCLVLDCPSIATINLVTCPCKEMGLKTV